MLRGHTWSLYWYHGELVRAKESLSHGAVASEPHMKIVRFEKGARVELVPLVSGVPQQFEQIGEGEDARLDFIVIGAMYHVEGLQNIDWELTGVTLEDDKLIVTLRDPVGSVPGEIIPLNDFLARMNPMSPK